jgi:hypothetical protein
MIRRVISGPPGLVLEMLRLAVRTVSWASGATGWAAVETGGWPAGDVRSWVTTVRSTRSMLMDLSSCATEGRSAVAGKLAGHGHSSPCRQHAGSELVPLLNACAHF